jgi:TolB-like protein/Tfp pilus assembly protein PilF
LAFEQLADAFIDDYMKRKHSIWDSGWRSLVKLAKGMKVSSSLMYGRQGGISPELAELTNRGLVESRVFTGERGRGGEVIRLRIAYEREPVKEIITDRIKSNSTEQIVRRVQLPRNRIAVLPFLNLSSDSENEYLADGLTEELIGALAHINDLDVIGRTSVMAFKKVTKTIEEIGRELRAGTLVEGSLRKGKDKVRVSVQLVDSNTSGHLWSNSYDRDFGDALVIQTEIAQEVAEALKVRILRTELARIKKKPTSSEAAYTSYLKGRVYWNKGGLEDTKMALACFQQAVTDDPRFAQGYVGLADSLLALANNWSYEPEISLQKAKAVLLKALELDPELAEAHASKGMMLLQDYKVKGAEAELREAIRLEPSYASAHQWLHLALTAQGKWDVALEEIEKAAELEPYSPMIHTSLGEWYLDRGDYRMAIELFRRALELSPGLPQVRRYLIECYGKMGRPDEARHEAREYISALRKRFPRVRMRAKALLAQYLENDKESVRRILPELEKDVDGTYLTPRRIADIYFFLGDSDRAFEWLEQSFAMREPQLIFIKSDPLLAGVRTDPRYLSLLGRLGLGRP